MMRADGELLRARFCSDWVIGSGNWEQLRVESWGRKDFVHVPGRRKAPWEPRSFTELRALSQPIRPPLPAFAWSYGMTKSWAFPRSTNPRHSGNQRPQSATAATGFAADTAAATAARRRHTCLYGWRSSCIV